MRTLNATAKRDFRASTCGHAVRKGERCAQYRERAVSYREACDAGSLYVKRTRCAECCAADLARYVAESELANAEVEGDDAAPEFSY
jgi:hypothetical protein